MSTITKVDPSTLGWVKAEIDETLKQARLALEAYVENSADDEQLRFCLTYLHQVVGTLQMVELDGPALLGKEAEALTDALLNRKAQGNSDTFELLTRAILSLPDYLARLQFGQPDAPLRLLPLLNELRAARRVEPIPALTLFNPDLAVRPPKRADKPKLSDAEFAAAAKTHRARFQAALAKWLKRPDDKAALKALGNTLDALERDANALLNEQLFWVARGLTTAFEQGSLEPTTERKKLFARVDQQIKRAIDGSDKSTARKASEALIKVLLFEIGNASSGDGVVGTLKEAFALDALLNTAATDGDMQDLPTPEALQSISAALGTEIETAQDLLSAYFDPEQEDVKNLEPLVVLLKRIANTLHALGIAPLKRLTDELIEVCAALGNGAMEASEAASMRMARALLLVESSARDIHHIGREWKQQVDEQIDALKALRGAAADRGVEGLELSDAPLTETEFKQLLGAVAGEIRVNLRKVEEGLEQLAANPRELSHVEPVPHFLSQIQGALHILGQPRAADLTALTSRHIQNIQSQALLPDHAVFDALAVAVGTLEVYLEGLERGRPHLDELIDRALQDLQAAIGERDGSVDAHAVLLALEADLPRLVAAPEDELRRERVRNQLQTLIDVAAKTERAAMGAAAQSMLTAVDTFPAQHDAETLHAALAELASQVRGVTTRASGAPTPAPAPPEIVSPAPAPIRESPIASPAPPAGDKPKGDSEIEDLDEEIMQIFIEDAKDVSKTVDKSLGEWHANTSNREALVELRRAFHTLKGSGRMVNASEIAELAWAVENLLNQVRENKLTHSPAISALLFEVQKSLPALIGKLETNTPHSINVTGLRAHANALAKGEDPGPLPSARAAAAAQSTAAPAPAPTPESAVPPAASDDGAARAYDPTLLQIFATEAAGHLETLRTTITQGAGQFVSHSLVRAAHTLQGNARSLALPFMAEACHEMERYLQLLDEHQHPLEDEALRLIEAVDRDVSELLRLLGAGAETGDSLRDDFHAVAAGFRKIAGGVHARATARPQAPTPAPGEPIVEYLDPELVDIFLEEATDILEALEESLAQWRADHANRGALHGLKRSLHTLKGGARMAGAMLMGQISHNTETLLGKVENGEIEADEILFDRLDEVHDTLVAMLDRLHARQPMMASAAQLNARIEARTKGLPWESPATASPAANVGETFEVTVPDLGAEPEIVLETVPPTGPETARHDAAPPPANDTETETETEAETGAPGDRRRERRDQIRVRTGLLNQLVNYAGEVSIARARMEQQIFGFREHLAELSRNVVRFRTQIRDLEIQSESQILYRAEQKDGMSSDFDPLEFDRYSKLQHLSRSLAESLHDLSTIHGTLDNFASEAETVLLQQARVNTELQEGLMLTRMIDFSTVAPRLRHIVRQTARELGKRADLAVEGADVQVDRNVLERMVGPFEHMIRNSLDHGIEPAAERARLKKPAVAKIGITTAQEGNEIVIRFADDGAGLNVPAILAKAIERGLVQAGAKLADDEVIQFILLPGFSTAKQVTHLSGRGVGMDVVHSEVKQLGGSITVDTQHGVGTNFIIRLPLTLSIAQALMVHAGEQLFAIPLSTVSHILEVPVDALHEMTAGETPEFRHGDESLPFMQLAPRLGLPLAVRDRKKVPVLLAKAGARRVAIQVDAVLGTREIVVKPLSPQLSEIKGLGGATILGDGSVVLILDLAGLWLTDKAMQVVRAPQAPAVQRRERPLVMVVDDSLTVRKVTSRHLQKRGMDVVVAKDGQDAWEQLRGETIPDVMLVDIEMPRMDGYELTANVRSESTLKHIPIVMITSRAGAKHRDRALALGVNVYMSKPYQEEELYLVVAQLLEQAVTP